MSDLLNTIIDAAIIGAGIFVVYEYVSCAETLGTYAPIPVLGCLLEKTVEDTINGTTCSLFGFRFDKDGGAVPCDNDGNGIDGGGGDPDNNLWCRSFGIGCKDKIPNLPDCDAHPELCTTDPVLGDDPPAQYKLNRDRLRSKLLLGTPEEFANTCRYGVNGTLDKDSDGHPICYYGDSSPDGSTLAWARWDGPGRYELSPATYPYN